MTVRSNRVESVSPQSSGLRELSLVLVAGITLAVLAVGIGRVAQPVESLDGDMSRVELVRTVDGDIAVYRGSTLESVWCEADGLVYSLMEILLDGDADGSRGGNGSRGAEGTVPIGIARVGVRRNQGTAGSAVEFGCPPDRQSGEERVTVRYRDDR